MQPIPFAPWVWRDPGLIAATVGTEMEPPGDRPEDDERASADLSGYDVEAIDGGIGKVDKANYEVGDAHLVVDTGPWIFGRKVLLPAGTVDRIDHDGRTVYVDRTKEQVKNSPEYDKDTFDTTEYRDQVGGYYAGTYE